MAVYELEFKVTTPVITQTNIHLDALFSFVSPASHNKEYEITKWTDPKLIKQLPLPIDAVKLGSEFIFCCSAADFGNNAQFTCENATKRRDGEDFMYFHKNLTPRSGIEKDVMMKLYGVVCESVKFRVSSSNLASLERYARRVKNIGSMGKQGYGEVSGFYIRELIDDWKTCVVLGGKAIRNIPQVFLKNEVKSYDCCRCPYWLPGAKEKCASVGDLAVLSPFAYLSEFRR